MLYFNCIVIFIVLFCIMYGDLECQERRLEIKCIIIIIIIIVMLFI